MADELEQTTLDETAETKRAEGDDIAEDGDYTGPKGSVDLPEPLINALASICRKMDQRELQPRINQVARSQKSRLFWRGNQYLKREKDAYSGGAIYTPIENSDDEDTMYVFNLYQGYGKSFIATFAQAPVGVRVEPNDPMISSDVEAAREAESMRKIVCKINNQRELQRQIARRCWTDGMVVAHSRMVTSAAKYGIDSKGEPRSYPEIEIGGVLEWKVPIAQGDFDDWDYVRNQKEISLSRAKSDYPTKAEKLKAGNTAKDIDYSRQARASVAEGLGLQTQSGDGVATSVTRSRYWLRPSAFHECDDETLRGELKDWFPNGAHVCFIGETYVESRDEAMDDHIAAFKAVDDDGYNAPGLGDSSIGPQESFNDGMNLAQITFQRGVPHSFVDQNVVPPDAIKNQKSRPGEVHPVQGRTGEALANSFHQENAAEAPTTLVAYLANIQGPLTQFLTGQQPALFGGEMGEAGKTASGYQQALAQAMGLMGLVWVPFKKFWATVMQQCVKIAAKSYPDGTRLATILSENNGDQTTVTVNTDNLKGQFLFYPETDENFPESWTAKKMAYQNLMAGADKNPVIAQILTHPDNMRLAKDLVGIPDLTIPGADACEKQMKEIEEMEKQAPVPAPQAVQMVQQAEAQGQAVPPEMLASMPMVSSIDLGKYDDDASEFQTCVRWLNSPAGQKAKRENPQWYQNVELHADAHKERIDSQQGGSQQKPPSESISFKDLPPSGKQQMAAQAGINLDPQELAAQEAEKSMMNSAKTLNAQ